MSYSRATTNDLFDEDTSIDESMPLKERRKLQMKILTRKRRSNVNSFDNTTSSKNKGIVTKRIHAKSISRPKRSSDRDTLLRVFKQRQNQTKPHEPINWTISRKSIYFQFESMSTQEQERRPMKKPMIPSMKEKLFDDNQDKDDVDNPDEEDIDDNVEVSIVEMLHLFSIHPMSPTMIQPSHKE
jgi:hypothetical protein